MKQIQQNIFFPQRLRWLESLRVMVITALFLVMSGTLIAAPVDNGIGSKATISATQLRYTTAPSGNISGDLLTTQPVVSAIDLSNNVDTDYSGVITLSQASSGTLSGTKTKSALSGIVSFTDLIYTATVDHEKFILTASDNSDLSDISSASLDSDVVATQLVFSTQPSPVTLTTNMNTAFTTIPVVKAQNANNSVDNDFNETITLSENGTGEGIFTLNSVTASAGIATFTGLTYTHNKAETLQFVANDVDATDTDLPSVESTDIVVSTAYTLSIAQSTDGAENNGSTPTDAVFTITVTPANTSGSAITGRIAYSGTATNGTDYATGATSFSIADNSSTATLTLDVTEDAIVEGTETVIVTLSSPSQGSLATDSATANLTDDDASGAEIEVLGGVLLTSIPSGDTSPRLLDDTDFGTASVTKTFSIKNVGDAALMLSGTPTVTLLGNSSAAFSVSRAAITPIAADNSTFFRIDYTPQTGVVSTATVLISSNDTDEASYSFTIQGGESSVPIAPRAEKLRAFLAADTTRALLHTFQNSGGDLKIAFDLVDSDGGTYQYQWASLDTEVAALLQAAGGTLTDGTVISNPVDISKLSAGNYPISVRVTDTTFTTDSDYFSEINVVLNITDKVVATGNDNLDSDGDGIVNAKDNQPTLANNISARLSTGADYVTKVPAGYRIILGTTAVLSERSGLKVSHTDLRHYGNEGKQADNTDLTDKTVDHVFDYIIEGITLPNDPSVAGSGNKVSIVFPLESALTAASSFHKYTSDNGWSAFVRDANNSIEWANWQNNQTGICPNPDSNVYSNTTNKTGKTCLRVTLQDGGANDKDGKVDGQIIDPFGVANPLIDYSIAIAKTNNGAENNSGIATDVVFTVTVTPTNTTGTAITGNIGYTGSALNGTDYATGATNFSIADGRSTAIITLDVSEDAIVEGTEIVTATLSNPSKGALATGSASAYISDDESYSISIAKTTDGAENNDGNPTDAVFRVTVSPTNTSGSAITGRIAYSGTATNGTDYAIGATTFSIANGASTATITLDVSEDSMMEETETIIATLSNLSEGSLVTKSASANIRDDESYLISIAKTTDGVEGNGGTQTNAVFTISVTPTNYSGSAITGNIAYAGSATNGIDYATGATTFSIAQGSSTATLTLDITKDNLEEGTEYIIATLTNPSLGFLDADQAIAKITNKENYSISIAKNIEGAESNASTPTDAVFIVSISPANASGSVIKGDIAYTGTATNGEDYATGVSHFSVANGASTALITLNVTEDLKVEGTETIIATLSNPSQGSLITASATNTINDDDNDDQTLILKDQSFVVPLNAVNNQLIGMLTTEGSQATGFTIQSGNANASFAINNQGGLHLIDNSALVAGSQTLIIEASNGNVTDTATISLFVIDGTAVSQDSDKDKNGISDTLEVSFGSTDTDKDGIPDALEKVLGRDIDASTDTDGDGTPDVIEVLLGSNPNIADSATNGSPIITIAKNTLNLNAKGTVSNYSLAELGIAINDGEDGEAITPIAYLKQGACASAIPYNYKTVCTTVPNSGFLSGVNAIWWLVTDSKGYWGRNEQVLNVLPQISFQRDRILSGVADQGSLDTQLVLSGNTVSSSAFTVPFSLSGSAQPADDYAIAAKHFTFQANAVRSDPLTIALGKNPSNDVTLEVTLDSSNKVFTQANHAIDPSTQFVTAGTKLQQTITLAPSRFYPPRLSDLKGVQGNMQGNTQGNTKGNIKGLVFDKTQGNISLSFMMIDPDAGNYRYSWANSDTALLLTSGDSLVNASDASPILDVSTLAAGRFYIEIQVTDSTAANHPATTLGFILTLVDSFSLSASNDSDGDGKTDQEEGISDDDGDGIPNYLDAQDVEANIVPTQYKDNKNFLAKTNAGLRIRFGLTAIASNSGDISIELADIAVHGNKGQSTLNSTFANTELSHIFDYEIEGFDVPADPNAEGNAVSIVLPLTQALTRDTTFHKYDATNGWKLFSEIGKNQIQWASVEKGVSGNCPEPSSTVYSNDLSKKLGKTCLKVTLQDGGVNDTDGVVNGRVIDPLGIGNTTANDDNDQDGDGDDSGNDSGNDNGNEDGSGNGNENGNGNGSGNEGGSTAGNTTSGGGNFSGILSLFILLLGLFKSFKQKRSLQVASYKKV